METTEGVANFFIDKAFGSACADLSQLKLQKLVYYAHGWHLGLSGLPLFVEPVQAWRYGPVIQSLRREFREFGSGPITRKARDIKVVNGSLEEREYALTDATQISPFLSRVWDQYGGYSAIQLTNMTHEPGTPWHQIATHYQFKIPPGITIPNELIREYFRAAAKK
jgi:uncharacterized phage-associated protein